MDATASDELATATLEPVHVHQSDDGAWFALPPGTAIAPFADAIALPIKPGWSETQPMRMNWKNQDFICTGPPYMIGRPSNPFQHPYVIPHSTTRDLPSTPFSAPSRLGGGDRDHPITRAWCIALLSTLVDDEDLFRFSGRGKMYTITPPTRSFVPLQRLHIGPGAIPTEIADKLCGSAVEALRDLNEIMGTAHALESTDGLADFLAFMIGESRDFGELYGRVRPWWYSDAYPDSCAYFESIVQRMRRRKANDDCARSAIIQQDSCIPSHSHPPPRHIWDLFSNRVLPYYAFRSTDALKDDLAAIDGRLWTVSHSWVAEEDREDLWTNINGREWPVPFPRATTLEHVRVELLNMGAEYVWLDVLCLRQKGHEEDEPRRLEEWKIDVPTIGFVYQGEPSERYCIIYLNGLGMPCIVDDEVVLSPRHWFRRAWTVQEAVNVRWLPGGLTADSVVHKTTLRGEWLTSIWAHLTQAAIFLGAGDIVLPFDLKDRFCTNELDRLAVISYCLHKHCRAIPVYNPLMTPEQAWAELIRHLLPVLSTTLFIYRMPDRPFATTLSMNDFVSSPSSLIFDFFHESEMLSLAETPEGTPGSERQRQEHVPGEYAHLVTTAGPYYIARGVASDSGGPSYSGSLRLRHSDDRSVSLELDEASLARGVLLPDVPYTLANIRYAYGSDRSAWVVLEAFDTNETRHGHPVVRAAKWGVIEHELARDAPDPLATAHGSRTAYVVYMHEDEARRRSAHAERGVAAFERMRAAGRACTFGDDDPAEDTASQSPDGVSSPGAVQEVPEDKAPSPSESAGCPPRKGAEHEGGALQAKASWFDGLRSMFCCLWRS